MIDLSGKKFSRLTAICPSGKDKHRNVLWRCLCECGRETVVSATALKRGKTKSCGCLKAEILMKRNRTHSLSGTHIYKVWAGIKQRCENEKNKRYKDYGGRGIRLCNEWKRFEPFYSWAIKEGYKPGLDIDRIDNNSGYSPQNCRFVTRRENCLNKRDNVYVYAFGRKKTISEWQDETGLPRNVIQKRIKRGWDHEISVCAPLKTRIRTLTPDKLALLKEEWGNG